MSAEMSKKLGFFNGKWRGLDENVYEIPGDLKLTDFNNLTNFGIEDPRMTTISGVAFRHLDRLPRVGDKVNVEGITITVLEMEAHRISSVSLLRTPNIMCACPNYLL